MARLRRIGAQLAYLDHAIRPLRRERDALIRALTADGRSHRFIAQVAGVSPSHVRWVLRQGTERRSRAA